MGKDPKTCLPGYIRTERREDTRVLDTVVSVSTENIPVVVVTPVVSIITESTSISTTLVTSVRLVCDTSTFSATNSTALLSTSTPSGPWSVSKLASSTLMPLPTTLYPSLMLPVPDISRFWVRVCCLSSQLL